jgi:hypothetical protein
MSRQMRWEWEYDIYWRRETHTGFWLGNLKERDHLEDLGANGRDIILK